MTDNEEHEDGLVSLSPEQLIKGALLGFDKIDKPVKPAKPVRIRDSSAEEHARYLQVLRDNDMPVAYWHEPDNSEAEVVVLGEAAVYGTHLDNSGAWGSLFREQHPGGATFEEYWLQYTKDEVPVMEVALATLLEWAGMYVPRDKDGAEHS